MIIKITFENEVDQLIGNVTNFEFPKPMTLKINLENGLCYCFYTKAIKRIEKIDSDYKPHDRSSDMEDLILLSRIKKIRYSEIAYFVGVNERTIRRWLKKYDSDHYEKILKAIEQIEKEKHHL